jgi:putative endonuclease
MWVESYRTAPLTARAWINLQRWAMRHIDKLAARPGRRRGIAPHLATGERGEREALFYLRGAGYTVVARRWKSAKLWGDIDLIAWDGDHLCFIEVKTRSERDAITAESAIDRDKQDMLRRMARAYLRSFPQKLRPDIHPRFDVVSVYLLPTGAEFDLYQAAFGW